MQNMRIRGGASLRGAVEVSGAKNSALPILFATLLTDQECRLGRVPDLQDIRTTLKLLALLGARVEDRAEAILAKREVVIRAHGDLGLEAPYDLVRTMRASVIVLGPLLARFGRAKVSLPGGCAIGARPIDYHLSGFEKLGASIELDGGYVIATAKRLRGARIPLPFPSVGATENLLMAATLAQGETVIENCAREPEIVDLARMLRAMGAEIEGDGTETIRVQGKDSLHGCRFDVMGDRIEAGTFLSAVFITRGDVTVRGIPPEFLEAVLAKFEEAGARVERGEDWVRLVADSRPRATDVVTQPFPGFPTDMQAQFMAVMALAEGASLVTEAIFENRFMHVPELARLGANISVRGNTALVRGVDGLVGAKVMATDLRASASLILAGLVARGETTVRRIYHLLRGYESMEVKLRALGADIVLEEES
jgi:UDP-N-acetylglucosamine 1-carboxyvinyltransferase